MSEVVFITQILTQYREPFHENVRTILAQNSIKYRVLFSPPHASAASKKDNVRLDWPEEVPVSHLGESGYCWQDISGRLQQADLVVLGQENKLLHNYVLQTERALGLGPKLAFFGHGRNFQSRNPNGLQERFKRFWVDKVDWWFAYTPRCADIVAESGFPRERITVFNNAIDTKGISAQIAQITPEARAALRQSLVGGSENVAVYVGGMYAEKRLDFLIDAAERMRARVPDFHLLMIGGGADAAIAQAADAKHDWIHYLGPKFGAEKTALVNLANVFLMPGLVGLAVIDSFAYGTPMVTTNYPFHSPEIDYLENDVNGVIVQNMDDAQAYADAVEKVLTDTEYRERLRTGARSALATYTIEAMAERFAEGVMRALDAPRK